MIKCYSHVSVHMSSGQLSKNTSLTIFKSVSRNILWYFIVFIGHSGCVVLIYCVCVLLISVINLSQACIHVFGQITTVQLI